MTDTKQAEFDTIQVWPRSSCQCGEHRCPCPPYDELVFLINNVGGYGGGTLVTSAKEPQREFFDCKFMGFAFEAKGEQDAREQIQARFRGFKHVRVS